MDSLLRRSVVVEAENAQASTATPRQTSSKAMRRKLHQDHLVVAVPAVVVAAEAGLEAEVVAVEGEVNANARTAATGNPAGSEVATPVATMTKSGRNVQKPTSFVPPPPSPTTTTKRKRTYRRNPESAVCKMCLRGTSPASNMIVFCDGCNTPYHRYCHQPPIEQAVIDEVDKEWYCQPCEKERIVPVPEAEVASFVSAAGAGAEQRQKYFASLPPGMLVTLLTKATTLKPDLPLFGPGLRSPRQHLHNHRRRISSSHAGQRPPNTSQHHSTRGSANAPAAKPPLRR